MYVTRQALDLCGLLDEDTFGLGYGEEVDFCLRASRVGLRHLVEDSTFVYHRGGVSFGDEQSAGWSRSSAILDARYPFFRPSNTRERVTDPLAVSVRGARARARTSATRADRTCCRSRTAASTRPAAPRSTSPRCSRRSSTSSTSRCSTRWSRASCSARTGTSDGRRVEREFLLPGAANQVTRMNDEVANAALVSALDLFDFDAVHMHNLIGHSLAPFDALADFDGPVVCSVHDLFLACPNFSLLYMKSDPCGIPEDLVGVRAVPRRRRRCRRCRVRRRCRTARSSTSTSSARPSRPGSTRSTTGCSRARARPTTSCASTTPEPSRVEIIEHGSVIRLGRRAKVPDERLLRDEPLRVAFVGLGLGEEGPRRGQRAGGGVPRLERRDPPLRPAEDARVARAARARRVRQRAAARPAAPRGHPGRAAPRSVRGDVRDRDERVARGRHPGDRRELRRARRAHPHVRVRMDDRPDGPRGHPRR